ncbi:DUF4192 domain-containing protein [Cryptosporangium sp. NPDC051539]|uniref:DUF4192 domain-containing protein n=1 Tax=Cryptosporangium sp. NPDC051539 TaxID=3363962 RepID=UPI0037B1F0F0
MNSLSSPPGQPVVQLRTPPEIVRAVPQLLGFHPAASVVLLGLAGPHLRLRMTMRIDLPEAGLERPAAEHLAGRLAAENISACVAVLFTAPPPDARPTPAFPRSAAFPGSVDVAGSAGAVGPAGSAGAGALGAAGAASVPSASEPVRVAGEGRTYLPGAPMAFAVRAALHDTGLEVRELLRAEAGRWWSYTCENPCCPPDGLPLGSGPTSLLEVLRVAAGRPVFSDRSAMVGSVDREPGEPSKGLEAALSAREDALAGEAQAAQAARDLAAIQGRLTRDAARPDGSARPEASEASGGSARSAGLGGAGGPAAGLDGSARDDGSEGPEELGRYDDRMVALAAVALRNLAVRDASFAWTGGPLADAAAALWRALVRRVPPPYAAAPATLLAVSAYRQGDGALADAYLRRALADDPDYRMADLVLTSLENGFRPSDVESALGLSSPHAGTPAPAVHDADADGRESGTVPKSTGGNASPRRAGGADAR